MRRKRAADYDSDEDWGTPVDLEDEEEAPKPKKTKKQAAEKAPKAKRPKKEAPETRTGSDGRTVRWSAVASVNVQQRIQRALPGSGHRMFLISTKELRPAGTPGGRAHEFTVLGATGNVYKVEISRHPTCDCPDHAKGNLCKHILFVYLRALKVAPNNPLVWQKALLTQEVEDILAGRHSTSSDATDILASDSVRSNYARLASQGAGSSGAGGSSSSGGGRRKVEGDCPICFDELKEGKEPISWCASCGNNIHASCCSEWVRTKTKSHAAVTCIYCRAPWVDGSKPGAAAAAAAGAGSPGGYVNLKQYSEAHRNADTSLAALYPETAQYIDRRSWRRGSFGL